MQLFNYIFLLFFFMHLFSTAQEELMIEDAIKIGLERNYNILIAKNEKEISQIQNNLGNAGITPQVSLNGTLGLSNLNSHQEFSSGIIQDRPGANSSTTGASINMSWIVFDGSKMFAIKKRLNQTEQLFDIALREEMESTVYAIIIAYYDIVRINSLIKAAQQNLSIYEERKKVAKLKLEIGADSKVDYLVIQSDENKVKSDLLQLNQNLLEAKASLNILLSRPVETDFTTKDSITIKYNPSIDELKKSVATTNSSVLLSKQNELILDQSVKEARSNFFPQIQLNAAYGLNRSQSEAGFVFLNRQSGINTGVSANWLLFDGNKNRQLVKERQIRVLNQKYATQQTQQQIEGAVFLQYNNFLTSKKIMELERENLNSSQEVLSISMERYKIGKSNYLETKEVQKNLEEAQVRYINALYNSKKSETELLKVNGTLIK